MKPDSDWYWVSDVHMANCHEGLRQIAKDELKIDVLDLRPGQYVMFTNADFTAVKVFGAGNTFLHHRSRERGHRLNPKATMLLPEFIKGHKLNYDKALAKVITDDYYSRYGNPNEK